MELKNYIISIIIICLLYLLFLVNKRKYRLILPSTIHTFTWLCVGILFLWLYNNQHLEGWFVHPIDDYDLVIPFILYLIIASIVGFSLSHLIFPHFVPHLNNRNYSGKTLNILFIDILLKKYHWILYTCFILGILQATFLISAVGFESLGDYRIAAVLLKRTGYGAFAQKFSGHAAILGAFYLALLGYKHGNTKIIIKEFIFNAFLFSMTNIAVAGRGWIVTAILPYITTYFLGRFYRNEDNENHVPDFIKLTSIIICLLAAFSLIGMARSNEENMTDTKKATEKFLYYVDGSYMTNIVFHQFPDGSFPLEDGKAEFLSKWIPSPMTEKFAQSIENNVALSVTVKSAMPFLYYDYGYWGGIFMWGVFCFILESLCGYLRRPRSVFSLFLFAELARILYQAPIGNIFGMEVPVLEWLIILYIFRHQLFTINNIECYTEGDLEGCESL